jgi:hypothetical protein
VEGFLSERKVKFESYDAKGHTGVRIIGPAKTTHYGWNRGSSEGSKGGLKGAVVAVLKRRCREAGYERV